MPEGVERRSRKRHTLPTLGAVLFQTGNARGTAIARNDSLDGILLESRGPRSLKIVTLLDKPSRRVLPIRPDYVGFEIPNSFVVGYGLDYGERYRQLPNICALENSA